VDILYFLHSGFLTTCACPENRVALHFFTVLKYILSFRIFEQLALAVKNRVAPYIFTVVNILYVLHSGFLTTCACPENRVSPEIFHCIEYTFYHSGFLSNLRLPWKTEGALNSVYWICIFYYSGFLSNLRFPWKTE